MYRRGQLLIPGLQTSLAAPTFDILLPKLRPGAVLLMDNAISSAAGYSDLFARTKGPESKFKAVTLPYAGWLGMAAYLP